jgi:hypothetical protein
MGIVFLLYILLCFKLDLGVYWYDWALFILIEVSTLFAWRNENQEKVVPKTNNIFKDV